MKTVYTVTHHYLKDVRGLFPKHKVEVLPQAFLEVGPADLVIFTGGEDVNPSLYNGSDNHPGWKTNPRDSKELDVLRAIRRGRFPVKKVLGICRGLQLLNVGFGGSLVFDIRTRFGKGHDYVHSLKHVNTNVFSSFLTRVNSLHHQCIESYGESVSCRVLAVEPDMGTIEMVLWENKYLAFQFHPELFPDHRPEKGQIAALIEEWVDEKISILSKPSVSMSKESSIYYDTSGIKNFAASWAAINPDPDEDDESISDPDDEEDE